MQKYLPRRDVQRLLQYMDFRVMRVTGTGRAERDEENVFGSVELRGSVRGTICYLLYSGGNERIPELASVLCT